MTPKEKGKTAEGRLDLPRMLLPGPAWHTHTHSQPRHACSTYAQAFTHSLVFACLSVLRARNPPSSTRLFFHILVSVNPSSSDLTSSSQALSSSSSTDAHHFQ